MKLIKPYTELLQPDGYKANDILRFITKVAYTCYKTDKEITNDSAKDFVNALVKSGHLAMLEHGTVYMKIPYSFLLTKLLNRDIVRRYTENPYSRVEFSEEWLQSQDPVHSRPITYANITTNLRVIEEHGWWMDLDHACEPSEYHAIRRTVKFITDRGVSHELVRHRTFSFAQESTRYCNYSKSKFGSQVTFIVPTWYYESPSQIQASFNSFLQYAEEAYSDMLKEGYTPQQARQVLPNALKTEIVLTAYESDWVHFFNLRARGTTGKPHPDMKALAEPLLDTFLEKSPSFTKLMNEQ